MAPDVGLVVDVDARGRRGSAPSRDVVPLVRRRAGCAIWSSRAADVVGLDPEPQVGLLAHEADVAVEVVDARSRARTGAATRQRGGEAVDVLGDAELGDAALGPRSRGSARRWPAVK